LRTELSPERSDDQTCARLRQNSITTKVVLHQEITCRSESPFELVRMLCGRRRRAGTRRRLLRLLRLRLIVPVHLRSSLWHVHHLLRRVHVGIVEAHLRHEALRRLLTGSTGLSASLRLRLTTLLLRRAGLTWLTWLTWLSLRLRRK
jgi:hypothetical protein